MCCCPCTPLDSPTSSIKLIFIRFYDGVGSGSRVLSPCINNLLGGGVTIMTFCLCLIDIRVSSDVDTHI